MPLSYWMNNQRVGELTKLANGAHTFKYARSGQPAVMPDRCHFRCHCRGGISPLMPYLTSSITCYPIARSVRDRILLNVIMPNPDNRLIYCQK